MSRAARLFALALLAAASTGCGPRPFTATMQIEAVAAPATTAPARSGQSLAALPLPAARTLVQGVFELPAGLVSIGSGGLVSIGSGGLVSIGSGGLVSIGSGGYRVLAAAGGKVAVPGAAVSLRSPGGEALDAALETGVVTTDAAGRYTLRGRAGAGVYRVEAAIAGHTFLTLVALSSGAPADATVDAATTLVASRMLEERGDLHALPLDAFTRTVGEVQRAIAAEGLPPGWTPAVAAATMADLERRVPAVAASMGVLREETTSLERREEGLRYRVQELAESLGVPPAVVAAELAVALSLAPRASDAELTATVRERAEQRASAPAEQHEGAGAGEPVATSDAPASEASAPAPTAEATPPVAGQTTEDPHAAGAPADAADDEADEKRARKKQPSPTPSATSGADAGTPATAPSPNPTPTPGGEPATGATPQQDAAGENGNAAESGAGGNGGANGNGNAGGRNDASGAGNGSANGAGNGNAGGKGNANGANNGNAGGNGNANGAGNGNAGGNGNANANGANNGNAESPGPPETPPGQADGQPGSGGPPADKPKKP